MDLDAENIAAHLELPESRDLGDVRGAGARREAHHRTAPERHLDEFPCPANGAGV